MPPKLMLRVTVDFILLIGNQPDVLMVFNLLKRVADLEMSTPHSRKPRTETCSGGRKSRPSGLRTILSFNWVFHDLIWINYHHHHHLHYSQELQKLFTCSLFVEMTNILQIYEPCLQLISLLDDAWEPNLDLNKFIWDFWSFENLSNLLRKIRI